MSLQVLGYVPVAELATLTAQVRVGNGLVLPDLEVLLDRVEVTLSLCADTAAALAAFADDLQHWAPRKSKCVLPAARQWRPMLTPVGLQACQGSEAATERISPGLERPLGIGRLRSLQTGADS